MIIDNKIKNFLWLLLDKILKIVLGIFLVGITARYFGVELFGIIGISFAYASVFSHIASLGLGNIIVREFVKGDINEDYLIYASIISRIFASSFLYILLVIIIALIDVEEKYFKITFLLINSVILFKWIDIVREYYESKVLYRFIVNAEAQALIICAAVKLGLIFLNLPFNIFIWVYLIENIITSYLVFRLIKNKIISIKINADIYKLIPTILSQSWPLIIVALTDMILLRVDTLMLGFLNNFQDVGEYSAAVRIAGICTLLPYMIVQTLIPSIIKAKKISEENFLKKISFISQGLVVLSYFIIIFIYIFGDLIITIIFGNDFSNSSNILILYSLTFPFMFLGVIGHQWYIANNMQKFMMIRSVMGSILAIIFSYFLIKNYGIMGAVFSVLISNIIVFLLIDMIFKETRILFWVKIKSIFFLDLKLILSKN